MRRSVDRSVLARASLFAASLSFVVVAGCGGKASSPDSANGGSSGSGGEPRACTEIGCANGADIEFSFREPGSYVVDVEVDAQKAVCKATLPLPRDPGAACDSESVQLGLVGSMLPADQQSIGGLVISTLDAKRIAVRVSRDGAVVAEGVFDPVPWVTSPGPNGPGCEPATCTQAKMTLK